MQNWFLQNKFLSPNGAYRFLFHYKLYHWQLRFSNSKKEYEKDIGLINKDVESLDDQFREQFNMGNHYLC